MASDVNQAEDLNRFLFCPRCGNQRRLVDQKSRAEMVGLKWPENVPHYTVECCGYQLSIEDDNLFQKVIELLKEHLLG
jgi:hypothetical protein